MEYYPDTRRAISRSAAGWHVPSAAAWSCWTRAAAGEARDLLARTREEVDRLIESPRAVTLHLEEADS